jgi:ribosomal subunit interface protein
VSKSTSSEEHVRVQIATRHCEVSDSTKARAEELVRKLPKYDPRVSGASLVFEVEKHLKKVEGILSVDRDEPVVAHGEGDDFRGAVDQMIDRLSRRLRRLRSQRIDHQAPPLSDADRPSDD